MPGDMYPVVCFFPFSEEKETYNILLSSITTKKQHTILYESGDIQLAKIKNMVNKCVRLFLSFREIVNIIKQNFLIIETMKRLACRDVGLDCEFVMDGSTEEDILNKANDHAWKVHAIKPEEMTSEMKVKIKDSIKEY